MPIGSLFKPPVAKILAYPYRGCQTKSNQIGRNRSLSTVDRALEILSLFSLERPSIGLSDTARMLSRDKATVLRHLKALENNGFLEQDVSTRMYHLGPSLAGLALLRDQINPINQAATHILQKLVSQTGETAHLSQIQGNHLSQVQIVETAVKATRVYIDPIEPLPLHASASGIAYLSALNEPERRHLLSGPLEGVTKYTPRTIADVEERVSLAKKQGYAIAVGTFETDVIGLAAPVYRLGGQVCGALAVVQPASRTTPEVQADIGAYVMAAAEKISYHYGANR